MIDLTGLTAAQGFIIQGDAARDLAGDSVSSAGDVNGDGFDDLIVGAYRGDDGGSYAGEAYVVFGGGAGFGVDVAGRQVVDLTGLAAAQGFIIQGDAAFDRAGNSVSSAGDVNGDGFDDLIVGAFQGDDGGNDAGEAYVVFGTGAGFGADVAGRQVIDLTFLTAAQGFIIQGDAARDYAGRAVSSAGDMNGDGFDDLIVGASGGDDGGYSAGEAYVLFGTGAGFGVDVTGRQVIDLTFLTAAEGLIIQGDAARDYAGFSVSSVGDVNGDGFDDLIVGAYGGDDGGTYAGEAYVVLGGAFGASGVPVVTSGTAAAEILRGGLGPDSLDGNGGADILRAGAGDDLLAVGDLTFQRIDGGSGQDTLRLEGGGAFDLTLIADNRIEDIEAIDLGAGDAGNAATLTLDLREVLNISSESNRLLVTGDASDAVVLEGFWTSLGLVTEGATTFNNFLHQDGTTRVLIEAGVAVTSAAAIELSAVESGTGGFVINGVSALDFSGRSVSGAGDVNGDGLDDLIVGAIGDDRNGRLSGASFVVFGKADETPVELSAVEGGTGGFVINGVSAYDESGGSVRGAGDINGDGLDDLIVGANGDDPNGSTSGASFVVFGKADEVAVELSAVEAGSGGFVINGVSRGDQSGRSVSGAGDVNGDGLDDLIVGALYDDPNGSASGASFVVFGKADEVAVELSAVEAGSGGFVINGVSVSDQSGRSVSGAGDIDGDGLDDLIVGANGDDPNGIRSGASFAVFGKADGTAVELSAVEVGTGGFVINGVSRGDQSGRSVSGAGDVNGDGLDDLIVGAPYDGGPGASFVVFGKADGTPVELSAVEVGTGGFVINGVSGGDLSGRSVSGAGDVNGDGFADLIVGAYLDDPNGFSSGASFVVFGKVDGTAVELSAVEAGSGGFVINGVSGGDRSGYSVSGAGDVNGDGFADLIVGADFDDPNGSYSGASFVVFGGNFTGSVDLLGRSGGQLLSGSAADEVINGGAGDDTLAGGGGADVLIGGEGDDVLAVADLGFERLQGGNGMDTLRLDGGGALDLGMIDDNRIEDIESIDLGAGGAADAAALSLDLLELLNLSTGSNRLLVTGDSSDSVDPGGLTDSGTDGVVGGITFDVFTDVVNGQGEELLIQQGIVVV